MAIAAIAEAGRHPAVIERVFEGQLVEIVGGHARCDLGHQKVQHLGRQPPGPAHALEAGFAMDGHRHPGAAGGFHRFGVGQFGHGT